jgi:hypothetical protein
MVAVGIAQILLLHRRTKAPVLSCSGGFFTALKQNEIRQVRMKSPPRESQELLTLMTI